MSDNKQLSSTPVDAQSPQASASTNSAIRAGRVVSVGISQENTAESSDGDASRSDAPMAVSGDIATQSVGELNQRAGRRMLKRIGVNGRPRVDLLGNMYGALVVIADAGTKAGVSFWLCRCVCGIELVVRSANLKRQQSCGCVALANKTKHGHAHKYGESLEYVSWQGLKDRCLNPRNKKYPDYGGRGIRVCDRWVGPTGFVCFLSDMGKKPTATHSIERTDVNGNYEPGNCCWATARVQARNKRCSKLDERQAQEIRSRRLAGELLKVLAAEYGVTMAMVCAIAKGRAWSRTSDS